MCGYALTLHVDSSKVFTFIDLAGHEKYIKTTVYGMTGTLPDYAMIVVGANMGVLRMTREHLGLALALKYPLIFAVTKIDMCPEQILKQTVDDICKILRSAGIKKMPMIVRPHFFSNTRTKVFHEIIRTDCEITHVIKLPRPAHGSFERNCLSKIDDIANTQKIST